MWAKLAFVFLTELARLLAPKFLEAWGEAKVRTRARNKNKAGPAR